MTALIGAEVDGQTLTDDELLGFCLLLILAGNDTTSSLIGTGLVLLTENPDQRELLLREPSRWSAAIEEINRVESPTQVLPDDHRGGNAPRRGHSGGSRVMLIWGSANHDDRGFAIPSDST